MEKQKYISPVLLFNDDDINIDEGGSQKQQGDAGTVNFPGSDEG